MKQHHFIASADFSKRILNKLAKKNIFVIGWQMIPDMTSSMPMANMQRCYCLDNNDTHEVRDMFQVEALTTGT